MENGFQPSRFRLIPLRANFALEWARLGNGNGPDSASTAYDLGR